MIADTLAPPRRIAADSARPATPSARLLPGILAAACFLPLLLPFARMVYTRPHYEFLPLIPVGAAGLAWLNRKAYGLSRPAGGWVLLGWLAVGWAVFAGAVLLNSAWSGAVAAMLTLPALAYGAGGAPLLRFLLPSWTFLWLAVPPPFGYDTILISRLQTFTAEVASRWLDLIGITHVLAGNVVEVPGKQLLVQQACSGIQSLLSVLTLTLFFALWRRRPLPAVLLLLPAAAFWVLAANVARVTTVAVLFNRYKIDASTGWLHETLGIFIFAVAVGLTFSTDRLIAFFTGWGLTSAPPATATLEHSSDPEPERPSPLLWPAFTAFCLPAAVQVAGLLLRGDLTPATPIPMARLASLSAEDFPAELAGFRRRDFITEQRDRNDDNGQFSRIWRFQWRGRQAAVSVDYPFVGWHELTACYRGSGWECGERLTDAAPKAVRAHLSKPLYQEGLLFFRHFDGSGQLLAPPGTEEDGSHGGLLGLISYRFSHPNPAGGEHAGGNVQAYQVQLLIESPVALPEPDQAEARAFFEQASTLITTRISGTLGGRP